MTNVRGDQSMNDQSMKGVLSIKHGFQTQFFKSRPK